MTIKSMIIALVEWVKKYLFQPKVLLAVAACWIVWQIVYVAMFSYDGLLGDPGFYVYYAEECIKRGTMYPDYSNLHAEFIFNPGWINFLILWIKLFGSVAGIPYCMIIFNACILWLLFQTAKRATGSLSIAYTCAYMLMILPSNTTIVLHAYSEIPFELFSLLSFYLILAKKSWGWMVLAGISIALAQWIRPLGIAWIVAAVFYFVYKQCRYKALAVYTASLTFTLTVIGVNSLSYFPKPVFQAKTGGINLLMGANDFATGGYCSDARRNPKGLGFIPNLWDSTQHTRVKLWKEDTIGSYEYSYRYTVYEVDSIYKARALNWIMDNPGRWTKLLLTKTYLLLKSPGKFVYTLDDRNTDHWFYRIVDQAHYPSKLLWPFVALFAFAGLVTPFWRKREITYVFIPIALCTGMTIVTSADVRYNFIFIPFMLVFASYALRYCYIKMIVRAH